MQPIDRGFAYETSHGWNNEKIKRRTSNVQHRTSNIDDATLYLFKNKPSAACDEFPSTCSGPEPVEGSQIEFRRVDSLLAFVANLAK